MTIETQEGKDIFELIGSFGRWQKKAFIYLFIVNIIGIWQNFAITFLAPNQRYTCVSTSISMEMKNSSNNMIFNKSNGCQIEYTEHDVYENTFRNINAPCTAWEYDRTEYGSTIVNEWDLVCDREWMISFSKSIYMLGFMVSVFMFGQISDYFGRFPTCIVCYVITMVSSMLSPFSVSYAMFVVLRFFSAFGRTGLTTTGYVLLMEITGPSHRTKVGVGIQFGWCAGLIVLPLVAYYVRSWFWLQLAISLPTIPMVCIYWLIPESPRWLLTQDKKEKLWSVMSSAAKQNGKVLKYEQFCNFVSSRQKIVESDSAKTFLDLMKTPVTAKRTVYVALLWMVNAFVYYALSYNTNDLAGNPYLNFFISGSLEFPSYAAVYFTVGRFGRKLPLIIGMMIGGGACAAIMAVPLEMNWLIVTFAMIGKFCITATFGLLYLYTTELFPTVVRNVAIGTCSFCARIGSIIAPFSRELDRATHYTVPYAINAGLTIISALLGFLLPETRGKQIQDTLEEADKFKEIEPIDTEKIKVRRIRKEENRHVDSL